ncbi:MAG: S46 family peptidase [Balneolaceae bacterium]|nr:S46 family peptidase [Balneolaceae bacterium]MBO6545195.1 S46 family peptidase [Balneolaceae bacterium]MBO6646591.1 S46 family peptidase [Balneolaceae bacterium]
MQLRLLLIYIIFLGWGCSSSNNSVELDSSSPVYNKGIRPVSSGELPMTSSSNHGVAKLYKGNSNSGSGIFISEEGLFLTNYSAIIDFIASEKDIDFLSSGFHAKSNGAEIPLQGISLLVEIEQTDVTDDVQKNITELSPNYEIYRSIQEQKTRLINERRGERNDLFVEIKDLYSGNRQIMTVYQIVQDIRLAFAPSVNLIASDISDSKTLLTNLSDEYVILRAYSSQPSSPFNPEFFFPISDQQPELNDELISFGFPGKTYRLESSRAINFYHTRLNPYINSFFDMYIEKEDSLASLDEIYALRSFANRYSVKQNLSFFETAQSMISTRSIIEQKESAEEQLIEAITNDTTIAELNSEIFTYINQAYDIAEQTADILYSTSYFRSVSTLDDLANIFSTYSNEENPSQELIQNTLSSQEQFLSRINIEAELNLLKKAIPIFKTIPEDQQPLMIFDLFAGSESIDIGTLSSEYVNEVLVNSFLFDLEQAQQVLESGSLNQDPLYNFLEEIAFSFETAQQNYFRHYTYLFPAQQVFTRLKMNTNFSGITKPDSDAFLSFNKGSLHPRSDKYSEFFYTTHDFSGKAQGTAILNSEGQLLGMVTEEVNHSILGNYIYTEESSFLKVLRISSILEEIEMINESDLLLQELAPEN